MSFAVFLLIVIVLPVVLGIVIYNKLVTLKNRFRNAWAQIDVQLQRRHDLIPNLVETAKAYMAHERETLEKVILARGNAVSAQKGVTANPGSGVQQLAQAEGALNGALANFFALSENYPELKANQTMQALMEELSSTENKVGFARQAYNDSVMNYNTYREQFPSNLFATAFGFRAAELFNVDTPEVRQPVKVSFS
ncbi:MAG: LemA family protein [Pseudomonadota bacterium]